MNIHPWRGVHLISSPIPLYSTNLTDDAEYHLQDDCLHLRVVMCLLHPSPLHRDQQEDTDKSECDFTLTDLHQAQAF